LRSQRIGNRHGTMEVVGVSRSETRDVTASLGPRGSMSRMSVGYTADRRECTVERNMGREIGRRPEGPFHDTAVQGGHDHVGRRHALVGYAARLDYHQSVLPRYTTRVAERVDHQAAAHELEIGLQYLSPQCFQHPCLPWRVP